MEPSIDSTFNDGVEKLGLISLNDARKDDGFAQELQAEILATDSIHISLLLTEGTVPEPLMKGEQQMDLGDYEEG